MNELHLFAGIGGGILAGELLGHRPVCAVENNLFCQKVLRQHWPNLPIYGDIRSFAAANWRGRVDVVAGGFPCQDISSAGTRAGLEGERSGLWFEMLRVVRDVEPRLVFVENSPMLRTRGLGVVLRGLADLGFDACWETLSAADVGACHIRKRLWILAAHPDRWRPHGEQVAFAGSSNALDADRNGAQRSMAHPDRQRREEQAVDAVREDGQPAANSAGAGENVADANGSGLGSSERELRQRQPDAGGSSEGSGSGRQNVADAGGEGLSAPEPEELFGAGRWFEGGAAAKRSWWGTEPDVGRVAYGVPNRVDRLRGLGNAQVPLQAATAFRRLMAALSQ